MNVNTENLIRQAGDNGWDFFQNLLEGGQRSSAIAPEALAKAEKIAYAWAQFYNSESGRAAVAHLIELTFERATYTAALGLPMAAAYGHGCLREGQNTIVHLILKMIAEGRKEQQPTERTPT
jgi:hypothetical protein